MAKQQETPERGREDVVQLIGEISEKSQQLLHDLAERDCANGGELRPIPSTWDRPCSS